MPHPILVVNTLIALSHYTCVITLLHCADVRCDGCISPNAVTIHHLDEIRF